MLVLAACAIGFLLGFGLLRSPAGRLGPLVMALAVLAFVLVVSLGAIMAAETLTGDSAVAATAAAGALVAGALAAVALRLARQPREREK